MRHVVVWSPMLQSSMHTLGELLHRGVNWSRGNTHLAAIAIRPAVGLQPGRVACMTTVTPPFTRLRGRCAMHLRELGQALEDVSSHTPHPCPGGPHHGEQPWARVARDEVLIREA